MVDEGLFLEVGLGVKGVVEGLEGGFGRLCGVGGGFGLALVGGV